MGKNKRPRAAFDPRGGKFPRGADLAEKFNAKHFCWRVGDLDWEGRWGWANVTADVIFGAIIPKLHNYESMTWAELDGFSGSHFVDLEKLCDHAQARLRDLQKDEQAGLFSVRVTGIMRVWGVRDGAILRVLWWDPEHTVCPSLKRGT